MYSAGAVSKKLKKYPNIISYLEVHHPDVFDVIENLAMHAALFPHRGRITFLVPDKELTAELKKITESADPEKATDIISHLILTDLFTSPMDFEARKGNIVSKLGRKFAIKSVSGDKVLIPGGELTLDTGFQPFEHSGASKRGNMAVWLLKGKVDYENAPVVDVKEMRTRKDGGADDATQVSGLIAELRKKVFLEEKALLKSGKRLSDKTRSAYLTAIARVARIFKVDPRYREEYIKFRSVITTHPIIDFYTVFCCHKLFDPRRVLAAYNEGIDNDGDVSTLRAICADFPAFPEHGCALFDPVSESRLAKLRDEVCVQLTSKYGLVATKLLSTYETLDRENTLHDLRGPGKVEHVYPAVVHEVFRNNRHLHLLLDQFAWDVFRYTKDIDSSHDRSAMFEDRMHTLAEIYYPFFDDPARSISFDKPGLVGQLDNLVPDFVRTFALKMPCRHTAECVSERVTVGSAEAQDPYSVELIDIDGHMLKKLESHEDSKAALSEKSRRKLRSMVKDQGKDKVLESLT